MASQQAKDIYTNLKLMFTEGEHVLCVRSFEKSGKVYSGYWDNFRALALFIGGEKPAGNGIPMISKPPSSAPIHRKQPAWW
jgi:hypothetical protein